MHIFYSSLIYEHDFCLFFFKMTVLEGYRDPCIMQNIRTVLTFVLLVLNVQGYRVFRLDTIVHNCFTMTTWANQTGGRCVWLKRSSSFSSLKLYVLPQILSTAGGLVSFGAAAACRGRLPMRQENKVNVKCIQSTERPPIWGISCSWCLSLKHGLQAEGGGEVTEWILEHIPGKWQVYE